ncbi:hypothetical protein DY000_02032119 [Brassica cretica]|uniref:Uncharacterized protein n=1 Tax=Brassica cretica TaxID=69181 RepID=A0ABQ7DM81_BRACR|nr:hypothetical protein DY000_02032119 [Brassica cretica]
MSSNLFDDEEDRSSGGCGGYGGEGGYEDGKREGRYKRLVDTMVVGVVIRKVEVVVGSEVLGLRNAKRINNLHGGVTEGSHVRGVLIQIGRNSPVPQCSKTSIDSSVFSGVISFFGHDSEIIHEWICGVSAYTLLQENRSTSFCYWRLRDMSSLRCLDIGVGFVCQLLALLIVSEMCKFKQLAWDMGAIYIAVYTYARRTDFFWGLVRDGATVLRYHPWNGLAVKSSSSVGLPEGKS